MRVAMPPVRTGGPRSVEQALLGRRSVREFSSDTLEIAVIGQLLWAAQGVTDEAGTRTAPSAGGLYPLEIYAVTPSGVFHYEPQEHALSRVLRGDVRVELAAAARDQEWLHDAPLVVVVTAVYARTSIKYGESRGQRYVQLEAGHATQNLLLQAVALDLAATPVGAFDDRRVQAILHLPEDQEPLYLVPVGRIR